MTLHHRGFPSRKSADRSLFAAPRSLSQRITSFFGSWCQGIHLMLLFAWTFCIGLLTFAVLWIAWVSSYIFRFAIKKLCFFTVSFSSCVFTLVEIVFLPYFVERPIFLNIMSSISVRFYSFTFIRFSMNMVLTGISGLVEMKGIEPLTPCLQGRCSPSWATPPYWDDRSLGHWKLNNNKFGTLLCICRPSLVSFKTISNTSASW